MGSSEEEKVLVIYCPSHHPPLAQAKHRSVCSQWPLRQTLDSSAPSWKPPAASSSHSRPFLVCFCLIPASDLCPRSFDDSPTLVFTINFGFSYLTREFPKNFSSHFPPLPAQPTGSPENTNLDLNSFACLCKPI